MTSPSPMKSPDRDAADELIEMLREYSDDGAPFPTRGGALCASAAKRLERQASELATLRRLVADMEEALGKIERGVLLPQVLEEAAADDLPSQMAYRSARLIARSILSPPTRKE